MQERKRRSQREHASKASVYERDELVEAESVAAWLLADKAVSAVVVRQERSVEGEVVVV